MKVCIKKSLLSEHEESEEKKKSGFEGGSETLSFFSLSILDLAMGASSLVRDPGVQCHFLQTCPHYVLFSLCWGWKKLGHLFQLWTPSWRRELWNQKKGHSEWKDFRYIQLRNKEED